jgi:hypothetical protein
VCELIRIGQPTEFDSNLTPSLARNTLRLKPQPTNTDCGKLLIAVGKAILLTFLPTDCHLAFNAVFKRRLVSKLAKDSE